MPKSDLLTTAAFDACLRIREDLGLAEAQLRIARMSAVKGHQSQALADAHAYLMSVQQAAKTAADTALNASQEAGREAMTA
jgi:hypothetical protein